MLRVSTELSGLAFSLATITLLAGGSSVRADYTVTNVGGVLSAAGYGATYGSTPVGLNNLGQVVGYYNANAAANSGSQVPFVFTPSLSGGSVVALTQVAAGFGTQASAINDAGIVVGGGSVGGSVNGFVYNSTTNVFTGLNPAIVSNGTNTPTKTYLYGINNQGTAVGYVGYEQTNAGTRSYRGITYNTTTGAATDVGTPYSGPIILNSTANNVLTNTNQTMSANSLGVLAGYGPNTGGVSGSGTVNNTETFYKATPNGVGGYAYSDITPVVKAADPVAFGAPTYSYVGVDDLGNVVGGYSTSSSTSYKGFFYNAATNTATPIDNGVSKTSVYGIADVGGSPFVVGQMRVGTSNRAFIWSPSAPSVFTDLTTYLAGTAYSGYTLIGAFGINSRGDIIVTGTAPSSTIPVSFLLTNNVPEPTALATLAVGGVALLRRRMRSV